MSETRAVSELVGGRDATIDTKASFTRFVYPFSFQADQFALRVASVEAARWRSEKGEFTVWSPQPFGEDDLLPHVARYLNAPEGTPSTAQLWKLAGDALRSRSGLGSRVGPWLLTSRGRLGIPFEVTGVHLALFRVGVGFLTIEARPATSDIQVWLDFLHYFRFVSGSRAVEIVVERRTSRVEKTPFFPEVAGGVERHRDGKGRFDEILAALLHTGGMGGNGDAWWRDAFIPGQLMPFAALFVDRIASDEIPLLLYRLRNFFHAHQNLHPSAEDLRMEERPDSVCYANRQWFTFSLDGASFVACDPPDHPFWRSTLPDHLKDQYFLLFLLVLHQRFALMKLSDDIARHWVTGSGANGGDDARELAFAEIRDTLLSFTARGYFAQVMQQEHHHRCYRKWQEIFQVERLYKEVSDAVQEMYGFLLMQRTQRLQQLQEAQQERTRRLERLLSAAALLIGLPTLALTGLSTLEPQRWYVPVSVFCAALAVGLLILVGIYRVHKYDRSDASCNDYSCRSGVNPPHR